MEDQKEQDFIRRRAYELWERQGSPEGRAEEFWEQAKAQIGAEGASGGNGAQSPASSAASATAASAAPDEPTEPSAAGSSQPV